MKPQTYLVVFGFQVSKLRWLDYVGVDGIGSSGDTP